MTVRGGKDWDELVKQFILGSEQQTQNANDCPAVLSAALQHDDTMAAEQRLLHTAALLASYNQIGCSPWVRIATGTGNRADRTQTEAAGEAPAEVQPYCSVSVARHLRRFLTDRDEHLVFEALTLLQKHRQIAPPDTLPQLLVMARKHPFLQTPLLDAMGRRGRWLCLQNPDWNTLVPTTESEAAAWPSASGQLRYRLFLQARQQDPDLARQTLAQCWAGEPAKERQALLEKFEYTLSAADADFLRESLRDRSQAVRQLAAGGLLRLEQPELTALANAFIAATFSIDKKMVGKSRLNVRLPEQFDEAWKVFGLQEKLEYLPGGEKIGQKAGWLYQWVTLLSPQTLARQLSVELKQWVELCIQSEFSASLLQGMEAGARRHRFWSYFSVRFETVAAKERLEYLGRWLFGVPGLLEMQGLFATELCDVDHLLIQALTDRQMKSPVDFGRTLSFLEQLPVFSPALSAQVVELLLTRIKKEGETQRFNVGQRLDGLGYRLALERYETLSARLKAQGDEHLTQLLQRYQQRFELHKEFTP